MFLGNGHSMQNLNEVNGETMFFPSDKDIAEFKQLDSLVDFAAFCRRMGYSLKEQWQLIDQYGTLTCSLSFGEELAQYKEKLSDTIFRLSGKKMGTSIHQDNIISSSPVTKEVTTSNATVETELPTFCLTQYAASFDNNVWDKLMNGMMTLGLIEPTAIAGFKTLLGIARHTGRYKPLKEKVPFNSSKKTLAFLIAMMYGTLRYTLPYDVKVGTQMIRKGEYACTPLIVTPSGSGPDPQGRTRDAYWQTVWKSVAVGRSSQRQDGGSTHGFATSRKSDLSPEVAAPIIALLLPLGCRRK